VSCLGGLALMRILSLVKKTLNRHRAGFKSQRESSLTKRENPPSAFRIFQYSVVLPNFPTESIKQSKA
jgi:hypothetical protein